VVEFYNKGGGNGLGLNVKNQTLSSTPLQLTDVEVKAIVSFMHSLKDSVSY
jgi:cytochrome c peroxidase